MKFDVHVDVTMSGTITVKASSQEEAMAFVNVLELVPSDLRNFHWVENSAIEAELAEDE